MKNRQDAMKKRQNHIPKAPRGWIPLFLSSAAVSGMIACSAGPSPTDEDDASAGAGGSNSAGGSLSHSGGASSASGGSSGLVVHASGGAEATKGDGGAPSTQDGGTVPLTLEQVQAIQMAECADLSAEADKLPAALQFVVDASGSMTYDAPTTGGLQKWEVAMPALLQALDGIEDHFAVGLQLFPTADARGGGFPGLGTGGTTGAAEPSDYCADASGRVDIEEMGMPGSAHRTLLETTLTNARLPIGTPTHDGYVNALEQSLKPYSTLGNKFMVLMTDGAPTQEIGCGPNIIAGTPPEPIIAAIAAAYAEGVSTFVIGSPGTEGAGATARDGESAEDTRPWLSEAAMVGGTGPEGCTIAGPNFCHLDMTTAADFGTALSAALAEIADKVEATCSFELPVVDGEEIDPSLTNVMINWSDGSSELVLHDAIGDCSDGWTWGPSGEIQLCAGTCSQIETDPDAIVAVSLGCTEEEIVITVK